MLIIFDHSNHIYFIIKLH